MAGMDSPAWKTLSRLLRALFAEDGGACRVVDTFVEFKTFLQDNDLARPGWLLDADEEVVRDKRLVPIRIVWDQVGDHLLSCELKYDQRNGKWVEYRLVLTMTESGGSVRSVEEKAFFSGNRRERDGRWFIRMGSPKKRCKTSNGNQS